MNYDKYQFVLDWDELPEDFKEEKITEYIEKSEKIECKECDGTGSTSIPASQEAGEIRDEEAQTCNHCGGSGETAPDSDDQAIKHLLIVFAYSGVSAILPTLLAWLQNDPRWVILIPIINSVWYAITRYLKARRLLAEQGQQG